MMGIKRHAVIFDGLV